MAPVWTSEQKKVIELHDRNILVSAAAGSGKTAVLVERIAEMISNPEKNIDIDKLVIVTFTNAAAAEMRQRLLDKIEERIESEPDNLHLVKQQTLINNAQITTIDSFCLNIIKNYFSEIDLDPGFKVGDEAELKLIMSDVLDDVIESYYEEADERFLNFVDCFTPEKTDAKLDEYILSLYKIAQSNPWPREWLNNCKKDYDCENVEEFEQLEFVKFNTSEMKKNLYSVKQMADMMKALVNEPDGPYMYKEAVDDDMALIESLLLKDDIFKCADLINNHKFARLSPKKDEAVSEEKKEAVKSIREQVKAVIGKITEKIGQNDVEKSFELMKKCKPFIDIYVDITLEFDRRFTIQKRKKNIISFNDMEHMALDVLLKKEGDKIIYSPVADELSNRYEEILIDEYQDSNLVQELILNSVSKERFGYPNVFMVGDVKQSIYRFRLARPELFIEKYSKYSTEDSKYQKVELHNNFRSRDTVLASVNAVFEKIMKAEYGKIEYDDNARLYPGAIFPECEEAAGKTQVLLYENNDKTMDDMEVEASCIAGEIQKLVRDRKHLCYDKNIDGYRPVRYSDIAILVRSGSKNTTLIKVLSERGIPVVSETNTGYFDVYEISLFMSLLNVIDNPRQDIPLAAVMKSYFGKFSYNEIASIKAESDKKYFFEALMQYGDDKTKKFMQFIDEYRNKAQYMPIHQLIWELVYNTGYYDYLSSMPMGVERQANVDMLIEKARAYEKTSYHGLFNFVRYMERLKKFEVDYGEASLAGEHDDVVRIMTIHKSKGLEFPFVFLINCSKKFNNMDSNKKIVIDSDFGIGLDFYNKETRVKESTMIRKTIAEKMRLDNLHEEQRILYVAMTRAREKLYISGVVGNLEKKYSEWVSKSKIKYLSYIEITGHNNYFDMIMPIACADNSDFNVTINYNANEYLGDVFEVDVEDEAPNTEEERTFYSYPYKLYNRPIKMTVSELKFAGQTEEEFGEKLVEEDFDEFEATVPQFISKDERVLGAERGSAYHKFMEIIDFEECVDEASTKMYLEKMTDKGIISKEWADAISIRQIVKFIDSTLGQEFKAASKANMLYREQQFVMGIPASDVSEEYSEEDIMLIQGVIDVYCVKNNEIILSDYKTDRVPLGTAGAEILKKRYEKQLNYYEKALFQLTGMRTVRKSIYSFCLGEEIIFV